LKKFDKSGISVLGVSKDSLESHQKFRKKHKLKITLGSDPDIKMAGAYGVWGEKTLYGRKYMGMERATFLIDAKGVIAQAWHKVKVPGHVEAVLAAAKAL
jgi:peroxiredoxin Q/BCP